MELPEQNEAKPVFKIVYNRPEDYKVIYANGVIGGWSGRGELNCNFYLEHPTTSFATEEYEVEKDEKGRERLGKLVSQLKPDRLVYRDLEVSIVLKLEDAEAIGKWILDNVKSARTALGEKP